MCNLYLIYWYKTQAKLWGGRPEQEYVIPVEVYSKVFQSDTKALIECVWENLRLRSNTNDTGSQDRKPWILMDSG